MIWKPTFENNESEDISRNSDGRTEQKDHLEVEVNDVILSEPESNNQN